MNDSSEAPAPHRPSLAHPAGKKGREQDEGEGVCVAHCERWWPVARLPTCSHRGAGHRVGITIITSHSHEEKLPSNWPWMWFRIKAADGTTTDPRDSLALRSRPQLQIELMMSSVNGTVLPAAQVHCSTDQSTAQCQSSVQPACGHFRFQCFCS